jgi:hypothetical protein
VRNAKGKIAETLRNETCLDDSVGTVGVPEDEYRFEWIAPVSDFYSGEYDEQTGTTNVLLSKDTPSPSLALPNAASSSHEDLTKAPASSHVSKNPKAPPSAGGNSFAPPPSASRTSSGIPTQEMERIIQQEAEELALVGGNRGGIGSNVALSGRQGRTREVTQLLNRNNAGIWLIDDFLSSDECDALVEQARPGLRRATVNEEGNNQAVSAYRNSQVLLLLFFYYHHHIFFFPPPSPFFLSLSFFSLSFALFSIYFLCVHFRCVCTTKMMVLITLLLSYMFF